MLRDKFPIALKSSVNSRLQCSMPHTFALYIEMYNFGSCPLISCGVLSTKLGFEGVDLSPLRIDLELSERMSVCVFKWAPVPRTTYRDYDKLLVFTSAIPCKLPTFHSARPMMVPLSGGTDINPSINIMLPVLFTPQLLCCCCCRASEMQKSEKVGQRMARCYNIVCSNP